MNLISRVETNDSQRFPIECEFLLPELRAGHPKGQAARKVKEETEDEKALRELESMEAKFQRDLVKVAVTHDESVAFLVMGGRG
jgi:hypothetical protein